MDHVELTVDLKKDVFLIQGVLIKANVARVFRSGCRFLEETKEKVVFFDFSLVSQYDSSTLALMFAWLEHAKQQHQTIRFRGVDLGLVQLAKLSNVDALLKAYVVDQRIQ